MYGGSLAHAQAAGGSLEEHLLRDLAYHLAGFADLLPEHEARIQHVEIEH